jgi:hypothetical protein
MEFLTAEQARAIVSSDVERHLTTLCEEHIKPAAIAGRTSVKVTDLPYVSWGDWNDDNFISGLVIKRLRAAGYEVTTRLRDSQWDSTGGFEISWAENS